MVALGFSGLNPGPIELVDGHVGVPTGKSLAFVGGPILLDGGTEEVDKGGLAAQAGHLSIVAVGSTGEVTIDS